jgi:hypothetical protein
MHSYNWVTKSQGRLIDTNTAREELEYPKSDPHAQWLRETFALANIQYGPIDYGLRDGKPQVWEINTNPKIIRTADSDPLTEEQVRVRDPIRQHFFPRFRAALEAIDSAADPHQTVPVEISSTQRENLVAEQRTRSRSSHGREQSLRL